MTTKDANGNSLAPTDGADGEAAEDSRPSMGALQYHLRSLHLHLEIIRGVVVACQSLLEAEGSDTSREIATTLQGDVIDRLQTLVEESTRFLDGTRRESRNSSP